MPTAEVAADRLFMPVGIDRGHWQPKGSALRRVVMETVVPTFR